MELRDAIRQRRSVRRYSSRPVPHEMLEQVLEDACWAPSAENYQPWHFVALTKAEDIASLHETQRSVLEAIPMDEPIAVDKLKKLGLPMGALLAAISVLQIKGLVRSLPGGMISRN